jgi:hypothetical protein
VSNTTVLCSGAEPRFDTFARPRKRALGRVDPHDGVHMRAPIVHCARMTLRTSALAIVLALTVSCADTKQLVLLEPSDVSEPAAAHDAGEPARDPSQSDASGARADAEITAVDAGPSPSAGPQLGADATTAQTAMNLTQPVLRYDFTGVGSVVRDMAGRADGRVLGESALDGSGSLTLDGVDDYVDLPNGVVSRLTSATFVAWVEWRGGICWQRVFDFGSSDAGENASGNAVDSLFLTPSSCNDGQLLARAEFFRRGAAFMAGSGSSLPQRRLVQVALTFDGERGSMELYVEGARISKTDANFALSEIDDVNNWLGRSQWRQDQYASIRYEEFRIYDRALGSQEIRRLAAKGPDTL